MGSGAGAVRETVAALTARGERVGVLQVRLFRPFSAAHFVAALPKTTRAIAVLDRTKEPDAAGEPLFQDVVSALADPFVTEDAGFHRWPTVAGGRYGLGSKEFTPAMAKAVFDNLRRTRPLQHFSVGINDDVTFGSLTWISRGAPCPRGTGHSSATILA